MWMQDILQVMSLFSSISYSFNYLLQSIRTNVVCDDLLSSIVLELMSKSCKDD